MDNNELENVEPELSGLDAGQAGLSRILGISTTAIDNNISFLKKNGHIERIGSKKKGSWLVK